MVKSRSDILRASHRHAHLCELPRALWYDDNGEPHYSIPYAPQTTSAPGWLHATALLLFLGAAVLAVAEIAARGL